MKALAITSVLAFIISLPLRWYQHIWFGASRFDTPLIMRRGLNQLLFLAMTFLLTCSSILGLWYFFGFWLAVPALCLSWLFGRTSWNRQFKSEVDRATNHYYKQMLEAKSQGRTPRELELSPKLPEDVGTWSEQDMKREAHKLGQTTARKMRLRGC